MLLFLIEVWFKMNKPHCSDSRSRSTALTVQPAARAAVWRVETSFRLAASLWFLFLVSIKSLHAY